MYGENENEVNLFPASGQILYPLHILKGGIKWEH